VINIVVKLDLLIVKGNTSYQSGSGDSPISFNNNNNNNKHRCNLGEQVGTNALPPIFFHLRIIFLAAGLKKGKQSWGESWGKVCIYMADWFKTILTLFLTSRLRKLKFLIPMINCAPLSSQRRRRQQQQQQRQRQQQQQKQQQHYNLCRLNNQLYSLR